MFRHLLLVATLLFAGGSRAQYGPLSSSKHAPQAKSEEEFDLYLEIYTGKDPRMTVEKVNAFAARYPESELLGLAYQYEMMAHKELNNYNGVLRAGEKALRLIPRSLNTLLALASVIPNSASGRPDSGQLLARAEAYARQALQELEQMRVPEEISLETWQTRRAEMESEAREALGHVAAKRGDPCTAIREFRSAVLNNPRPNGRQFLRLGSAYILARQYEAAEEALRRAAEIGEDQIRQLALDQLQKLKSMKLK